MIICSPMGQGVAKGCLFQDSRRHSVAACRPRRADAARKRTLRPVGRRPGGGV
jgi:hypothetical protein